MAERRPIREWPELLQRLLAFAPGLLAYVICAIVAGPQQLDSWWFFVGLGVFCSAVFVEHHFTAPQDAVVNSVAAIGAIVAADRDKVQELWWLYLGMAIATLVASLLATLRFENLLKRFVVRWATRFGRIVFLGGSALMIEFVRRVTLNESGAWVYGLGVLILLLVLSDRWYLALGTRRRVNSMEAVDVIGPGLLLLDRAPQGMKPGQVREVVGADGLAMDVLVTSTLPGAEGRRAVISPLDGDWTRVRRRFPSSLQVSSVKDEAASLVGLVGDGSDSQTLRFEQALPVTLGDTLAVTISKDVVLYQVVDADLHMTTWDSSKQLVARAVARQIGTIQDGHLRVGPHLPAPHAQIERGDQDLKMTFPEGYIRIGVVQGTGLAIGVSKTGAVRGHLAILGMTGMGKTTVVSRLCTQLGVAQPVVALDVTGEYAARLGWSDFDATAATQPGTYVHELTGELVGETRDFMGSCLARCKAEYVDGSVLERVLVFEEAHGMLPEQNIATFPQKEAVGVITRDIMQSRKYGLSFIFVSQRTAVISKSALSQCESYIVLRTLDDTSLTYLEAIAGPIVRAVVPKLARYEALCFGPAFNSENPIVVSLDALET